MGFALVGVSVFLVSRDRIMRRTGSGAIPDGRSRGRGLLTVAGGILLGALLIGSLPAVWLASRLTSRVPEKTFRLIMATLLICIVGRMIAHSLPV